MKNYNSNKRGDLISNRLFFYLIQEENIPITSTEQLKPQLYKIKTAHCTYILKGYSEISTALQTITISLTLQAENISPVTYPFKDGSFTKEIGGIFWVLMEYITPVTKFSFYRKKDRVEGLHLLQKLHAITSRKIMYLCKSVGEEQTLINWKKRLHFFQQHVDIINKQYDKYMIEDIIEHSERALQQLEASPFHEGEYLLHGDVASHNFIKGKDHLYLIDFDLATIGAKEWDYVQYINRLMPSIKWDEKKLLELPFLPRWIAEIDGFYEAVTFPMDILREGNRLIQGGNSNASYFFSYYVNTWITRKNFLTNIIKVIK